MTKSAIAVFLYAAVSLAAQGEAPRFDVVSVKPAAPGASGGVFNVQPGGRVLIQNLTLNSIIGIAYSGDLTTLLPDQIAGEPGWIHTQRYDIEGKIAGSAARDPAVGVSVSGPLLRSLLADRFKLRAHFELRVGPVYVLVLIRADGALGAGLHVSAVDCTIFDNSSDPAQTGAPRCGARVTAGVIEAGGLPFANLVAMLENALGRQTVLDRTGLSGPFDVSLNWAPGLTPSAADNTGAGVVSDGPSIFTAIQEQLGLKLESRREARQVLVIDHIETLSPD